MKKAKDSVKAGVLSYYRDQEKSYEQLDAEALPDPGLREKPLGVVG